MDSAEGRKAVNDYSWGSTPVAGVDQREAAVGSEPWELRSMHSHRGFAALQPRPRLRFSVCLARGRFPPCRPRRIMCRCLQSTSPLELTTLVTVACRMDLREVLDAPTSSTPGLDDLPAGPQVFDRAGSLWACPDDAGVRA